MLGNIVPSASETINLTLTTGVLMGTTSTAAVKGLAVFDTLAVNVPGSYTMTASTATLKVTSNSFDISTGMPAQLGFIVQPSTSTGGASIAPAVQVAVEDAFGNVIMTGTDSITLAIGNFGGPGTLFGTLTQPAVGGVATFADLVIDKVGMGYTLAATATGYAGATSTPFDITVGLPSGSISTIVAMPLSVTADGRTATSLTVTAMDIEGNVVPMQSVALTVSGTGWTLGSPTGVTSTGGVFVTTLTSTVAEQKTVTAYDRCLFECDLLRRGVGLRIPLTLENRHVVAVDHRPAVGAAGRGKEGVLRRRLAAVLRPCPAVAPHGPRLRVIGRVELKVASSPRVAELTRRNADLQEHTLHRVVRPGDDRTAGHVAL